MSTLSSAKKRIARTEAERRRDQWLNQMDAQDNKCAECHAELELERTAKRGMTREIICQTCYQKTFTASSKSGIVRLDRRQDMANAWKRFFLWVAGWRLVKPAHPEPQSIEIDPNAQYVCLVNSCWVRPEQARHIGQSLPRGSAVFMINCSGGDSPMDVVQFFKMNS